MSKANTARSRLRATLFVPCTMTLHFLTGCAETTLETDPSRAALAPDAGDYPEQLAGWPMPDAVAGSKTKPSYSASGSSLVVDNVTGLAWQRAAPTEFAASDCIAGDGCTWTEAKAYCDDLSLGTHDDFRLPTKIELESIVDDTQGSPTIDPEAFPAADADVFWTASPLVGASERAWIVAFTNGFTFASSTDEVLRVRCVRTERKVSAPLGARFTVDSATQRATVTDARTGLVWQQAGDILQDLTGANTHCASLGSGWRLPTKKELLTLVDPTIAPRGAIPAVAAVFSGTAIDANFWSSTPAAGAPSRAWVVNVSGPAIPTAATTSAHVRCVR